MAHLQQKVAQTATIASRGRATMTEIQVQYVSRVPLDNIQEQAKRNVRTAQQGITTMTLTQALHVWHAWLDNMQQQSLLRVSLVQKESTITILSQQRPVLHATEGPTLVRARQCAPRVPKGSLTMTLRRTHLPAQTVKNVMPANMQKLVKWLVFHARLANPIKIQIRERHVNHAIRAHTQPHQILVYVMSAILDLAIATAILARRALRVNLDTSRVATRRRAALNAQLVSMQLGMETR